MVFLCPCFPVTILCPEILQTQSPPDFILNSLKDLYFIYTQAAKDALGITEASQGRTDRGKELSGRALEILAANTQGRLGVKQDEKDIAYTELYRMWYDFLLAFADHRMPYRTDGQYNKPVYGYWDKSKLIKQDDAGEWYYPEFDIFVQAESALPKDKRFILDLANQAGQRIDNVEYWMLMESIGVPNASAILEMEQQKLQAQPPPGAMPGGMPPGAPQPPEMAGNIPPMPEMQNALPAPPQEPMQGELPPDIAQLIQQLPPDIQQQLLSMPPEQQAAFLMQLLQQGEQPQPQAPPEIEQVLAQLPPELQAQFMQLLQVNPEAAMAMLQQILGQQAGSF